MKKNRAITFLAVFIVLIVLGAVFALVSFDKGQLGNFDYKAYPKAIKLGLDLKGGIYAVYEAKNDQKLDEKEFKSRVDGTVVNFETLLFSKGYSEALITKNNVSGNSAEIRVEVPDVDDPSKIFDLIGKPAVVLFKKTDDNNFNEDSLDVVVTGKHVKNAFAAYDENGRPQISLEFNKEGTERFAKATAEMKGKPIHIFVNQQKLSSPTVQAVIADGKASITGSFTPEAAEDLAIKIQSGSLPLKLTMLESDTVSPTLGEESIRHGLIAGGVALILIFILLCALYGMAGLAASLALVYYTFTYLFLLAVFPWVQLTLAGIAGILLSIGMAVDANVIIFERMKEEYRGSLGQKTIETCSKNAFRRSASAIFDGNITTIIGAIVLMIFGVSSIKGFAITLLIGIVVSLFSSLIVTRLILHSFISLFKLNPKLYGLKLKKYKYLVANKDESVVEDLDSVYNPDVFEVAKAESKARMQAAASVATAGDKEFVIAKRLDGQNDFDLASIKTNNNKKSSVQNQKRIKYRRKEKEITEHKKDPSLYSYNSFNESVSNNKKEDIVGGEINEN